MEESVVEDSGFFGGRGGCSRIADVPTHTCHTGQDRPDPSSAVTAAVMVLCACLPSAGMIPVDELGAPGGGTTTANSKPRLSHRMVGARE